ncbi:DUF559 domain-containing protein [Microlunatus elymi]|uniref:DUF559 domain-containing protein n=1 Tax=Microlunatus elymi TaxID=2596828 RepID=UPI00143DFBC6|nr:DUF559 domain-containing protein [Microlunatus elymi]
MARSRFARELATAAKPLRVEELRSQGVGRGALRGAKWRKAGYGVYAPTNGAAPTTAQRIVDCVAELGDDVVIGGWAAAYVLGVDWLDGLDPFSLRPLPIDVLTDRLKRRSTSTKRFHRLGPMSRIQQRNGIRITGPIRSSIDGARWATSLPEAIVFVDSVLAFLAVRDADLASYLAEHPGISGHARAEHAVKLARRDVRSPWESRLRYCYRFDAGLPEPLINSSVFSARNASLLGIPDLFDPDAALAVEYDGDQHRDRQQHRLDNLREEALESANVTVVRVTKADIIRDRRGLRRRILDGHRRGTQRNRSHDSWTLIDPDRR